MPNKDSKRKPHNIFITDAHWEKGREVSQSLNLGTSIFLEHLINNFKATQISLPERLKSEDPATILWTSLAFTHLKAKQLNILPVDKDKQWDFLSIKIASAMSVMCIIGDVFPELHVRDVMPPLRWLILQSLVVEKPNKYEEDTDENKMILSEESMFKNIEKTLNALAEMKVFSPPQYHMIKLRHIEGLTSSQIEMIQNLQGQKILDTEIIVQSRQASVSLRKKYLEQNGSYFNSLDPEIQTLEIRNIDGALEYYNIARLRYINDEISELDKILQKSKTSSQLDFWLNEIDNQMGNFFNLSYDEDENLKRLTFYKFDKILEEHRKLLRSHLKKCLSRKDLYTSCEHVISSLIGKKVVLSEIPIPSLI